MVNSATFKLTLKKASRWPRHNKMLSRNKRVCIDDTSCDTIPLVIPEWPNRWLVEIRRAAKLEGINILKS